MTSEDVLAAATPPVATAHAAAVMADLYDLSGEVTPLPGDRDRNFVIRGADESWMLKIAHPAERAEALAEQQRVLLHVRRWDPHLCVPMPIPTVSGSLVGSTVVDGLPLPVRLTSYIEGVTVDEAGWTAELRRGSTQFLARLGLAIRSFSAVAPGAPDLWQIERLTDLRVHLGHLTGDRYDFAACWLDHYENEVQPRFAGLRRQVIHGDFNPANLIVDSADPTTLAGVIDFGDMTTGPLVADLAIALAYQCLGADDPATVIAESASSYHRIVPLTVAEIEILPELAMSRMVQSLIISGWRSAVHPDNREYILLHADPVWETLQRLAGGTDDLVVRVTKESGLAATVKLTTDDALAVRRRRLGSGMRLTYDIPLRVATGSGVWLTDTDGVRHLDAYNNVAHVGHSQPDVVAALVGQAGRLNTNTRYLVDGVADYADRLVAMLPDPLEVVLFANSGSEANDLALRMARSVTGRRGMVVSENAYHGSTYLTMAISPEELGIERLESWVATVTVPGSFAVDSAEIDLGIEQLGKAGEQLAGYICDTVFSSDGIYEPPPAYLPSIYQKVRGAGGLCIADEVQAGFGRVGSRLWGFAGSGVVPDIVTLGKPMGNGHPLAAVVTTRSIAEEFFSNGYYFSTFAGNPVSAAVGSAVLDVMERHNLPSRVEQVAGYLKTGLAALAAEYPVIREVRGPGMFIGVDLAYEDGRPATEYATYIQNQMRNKQVLIGRTGPAGNVLKIRPPLVFAEEHADLLLNRFRSQLSLDFSNGIMG
ncbi:MAG: aminotransferase class III-fold pyridoxal phosphate-dependent enzyme [bacterium]|nr:aminotransferase class III-fold pyridoxal phosphate-dependent enzyme [bacterium]